MIKGYNPTKLSFYCVSIHVFLIQWFTICFVVHIVKSVILDSPQNTIKSDHDNMQYVDSTYFTIFRDWAMTPNFWGQQHNNGLVGH
jgi:hypothetical protein